MKPGMLVHRPGLAVKTRPLGNGIVEGYLIAWGDNQNADLEGQWFTKATELRLDYFNDYPLLYHHGLDRTVGLDPIGRIKSLKLDDVGVWVQAQVDLANKYGKEVYDMIRTKQFGWSSGSIDHLVKVHKSGEIRVWPLFEGSITPVPAQPHKTTVRALKSLLPSDDPVRAYLEKLGVDNDYIGVKSMARRSTKNMVRGYLSEEGFQASEEDIEGIATDFEEEGMMAQPGENGGYETSLAYDGDEDAMMMDDDEDAMMMDDDEDDAMMMDDDEDDATMMDDDEDAMMMDDDEDAMMSAYLSADEDDDEDEAPAKRLRRRKSVPKGRRKSVPKKGARKSGSQYERYLEKRVTVLERMEAPGERKMGFKSVKVTQDAADKPGAYKSAFEHYIRFGEGSMGESQKYTLYSKKIHHGAADSSYIGTQRVKGQQIRGIKALNTSNAGSVGFSVPDDFVHELNRNVMVDAEMASNCKTRTTTSDRILIPDLRTTDGRRAYAGSVSWPGESPSAASDHATTEITLAQIQLPIHVMLVNTTSTYSALEDSAFDLSEMISEQFSEQVSIEYETLLWSGDGQGKMSGIVNDTRVTGSASTAVSSVGGYLPSGKVSTITDPDVIRSMILQLPPGYRKRAKWYMNSQTADAISQIKDGIGRYLWGDEQGFNQSFPTTLLQRPIVYNEFADDIAADAYPLILGDLSKGYTIGKRVDFSIRRFDDSTYAVQDQVLFLGRARLGGQVTQPAAIKVLKIATS